MDPCGLTAYFQQVKATMEVDFQQVKATLDLAEKNVYIQSQQLKAAIEVAEKNVYAQNQQIKTVIEVAEKNALFACEDATDRQTRKFNLLVEEKEKLTADIKDLCAKLEAKEEHLQKESKILEETKADAGHLRKTLDQTQDEVRSLQKAAQSMFTAVLGVCKSVKSATLVSTEKVSELEQHLSKLAAAPIAATTIMENGNGHGNSESNPEETKLLVVEDALDETDDGKVKTTEDISEMEDTTTSRKLRGKRRDIESVNATEKKKRKQKQ